MRLNEYRLDELLPDYLLSTEKGRIKTALEQFFDGRETIEYSRFYVQGKPDYLMQSDILESVFGIYWNEESNDYATGFTPAFLISNTCDISDGNNRGINKKQGLFAPVTRLPDFIAECEQSGQFSRDQINNFVSSLKRQELTNLFYLPPIPGKDGDYMVRFDMVFWVPSEKMSEYQQNLDNRVVSLSHWAHMLFLVKYSFHSCRVPETLERPYD